MYNGEGTQHFFRLLRFSFVGQANNWALGPLLTYPAYLGHPRGELGLAIFAHVALLCRKRLRPQNTLDLGQGERFEVGAGKRS